MKITCLDCLHCKIKCTNFRMGYYAFARYWDGFLFCKKKCWTRSESRRKVSRLDENELASIIERMKDEDFKKEENREKIKDIQIKKRELFKRAERCSLFESMDDKEVRK